MKLVLLFIFALTTPFFIFLTEVLFGATNPADLKKGLAETSIYNSISEFIIKAEPAGEQDTSSAEISLLIYDRFTPAYIRGKTEKLIDDAHVWITKDGPSPVLSFTDIKDDLIANNPAFRTEFEQIAAAAKQQEFSAEESFNALAGDPTDQSQVDSLTALAQNDFTVPVGEYFQGIKSFYTVMKIVYPMIAIVLLGILLLLIKLNATWTSRLRWIGSTLITAAAFGGGMVIFNKFAVDNLAQVTMSNPENFLAAFSPVMLQLMNLFMATYAKVQIISSIIIGITGTICVISAVVIKSRSITTAPAKPYTTNNR